MTICFIFYDHDNLLISLKLQKISRWLKFYLFSLIFNDLVTMLITLEGER